MTPYKYTYKCRLYLHVFFHWGKIENMGGWRPTKHNYRYRMYLNVFFRWRKIKMWMDGALLNTITNAGCI